MTKRVVILDYEFENIEQEKMLMERYGFELVPYQCRSEEQIMEAVKNADGILNQYSCLTRRVVCSLTRCQVIATYGIGVDRIDVKSATERGICVANVPDYCMDEVSNHTISLILCLHRRLFLFDAMVKKNKWTYKAAKPIFRLCGSNLGVVALGRIGREVVRKMKPFGMNIFIFDPYVSADEAENLGGKKVSLEELLQKSDIVTLHAPLIPETYQLIGREELKMMKKTAILINVGRGQLVDEDSLYQALHEGWISSAGIDVLQLEPPDRNNPLLTLENLIVTPHAAWYSEEALSDLQRKAAEEVVRVLGEGRYPYNLVNKEVRGRRLLQDR